MSAIHHIRTKIMGLTQREFAAIAKTTQPTVQRWENGQLSPDLCHLKRIRASAIRRRIAWQDRWFFERSPAKALGSSG